MPSIPACSSSFHTCTQATPSTTSAESPLQLLLTDVQLREIAVGNGGGVASVHVDGFEQLMPIFIGVAEAAALVYATTGGEGRRPSTLGTWRRSLEVRPCCIPSYPLSPPAPPPFLPLLLSLF